MREVWSSALLRDLSLHLRLFVIVLQLLCGAMVADGRVLCIRSDGSQRVEAVADLGSCNCESTPDADDALLTDRGCEDVSPGAERAAEKMRNTAERQALSVDLQPLPPILVDLLPAPSYRRFCKTQTDVSVANDPAHASLSSIVLLI
ncbi:MAG: hypothetical protein ACTHM6_00795 [Tepidisphaeraceae bacterium]